ncbi:YggS family pyridoxal phosphate-dependent enzyme [Pseudalkalibacillus caeni]|uniref:Pyridoxal phosphate homeostasis protein n=1 Tax=Exobacillus caeni TaxID=2574798 RepID=A0A5R9EYH8_9BACL|nr:YggS family pyridoxal phosphate-dependent enzyme [Pseudalkalibacillus caeni]TLS35256.1 YggS family pyridoxal phosphate-dependent enzyme [Pseudalkalibacillus caeni]
MSVRENLEAIKKQIEVACTKNNRNSDEVNIIAVTKYVSIKTAEEALESGVEHLGESRDFGLLEKYEALGEKPVWHFIGTLQSRKVKDIIGKVDYIHSLDRLSLAKEIQKRAEGKVRCFVQVNISEESSKHGLSKEDALTFIKQLERFSSIEVVGLMTMAPHTDDKESIRTVFRELKELQEEVKRLHLPYAPCNELSMGMSNDFEIAVEEGATFVRIGTALVGKEL